VVVMILVAMTYANTFLDARMAENEFSTNRQFMLTTGLQIDDIAWTIGRTQTVRYSSQYGNMKFQPLAVNYTFEIYPSGGPDWVTLFSNATGMILYNVPVGIYSISNNYFERISPASNGSFLQLGPSAPVSHVFCIEKLPMREGNYTRIVVVPSIRMLNSTIAGQEGAMDYFKFYLPTLEPGTHRYLSQSITLTGDSITKIVRSGVNQVRINVTFPNGLPISTQGFDYDFFNFDHTIDNYHASETVVLPPDSVVEFYVGKVIVTLGQV
jgi:hypothetical protein